MKRKTRVLALALLGLLLTTACEAFPTSMQDDPEAMEPIGDMVQDINIGEPPTSEAQQRIVFQQGPIRPEIYTMATNGDDPVRLTKNVQADREPNWSFDAKKIVYRCHVLTFCMSNPDGSGAEQVYTHTSPSATDIGDPKLSPDGRSIMFDAEIFKGGMESTVGDILIVNLQTKNVTNLTNSPTQEDDDPAWHPLGGVFWVRDGRLAFDGDGAPGGEVFTLTPSTMTVTKPDVSPSGDRIAYVAKLQGENQTDVYVFDTTAPAETPDQKVTFTPFDDLAPSWSPSETKIAMASRDQASDRDLEIFVVNLQPSGGGTPTRTRLTFNSTDETEPDWGMPQVTASIQQRISLREGDPATGQETGSTPFAFAVFLSAPVAPGQQVTVRASTTSGSASVGSDYTAVNEVITFNPGEQTKTFTVPVVADKVLEPNESLTVRLTQVTNALEGNVEGRMIISNDDEAPPPSPSPSPSPSASPPPPGDGQIAFATDRLLAGDYDIWMMSDDGGNQRALTSGASVTAAPDINHAGTQVVYHSGGSSPPAIFSIPTTGGTPTKLQGTPDTANVTPAWSPDDGAIVWAHVPADASGASLLTARPPSGTASTLADEPGDETYPDWGTLANGHQAVAFDEQNGSSWTLRLKNLTTGDTRNLGSGRQPDISPDGTKLVYANGTGDELDVYVIDLGAPTPTPVRLTDASGPDSTPVWSPDGSRIAFTSHRDGNAEIYTMSADGTNEVNISNTPGADDFEPSWGPVPVSGASSPTGENVDGAPSPQPTPSPSGSVALAVPAGLALFSIWRRRRS